MKLHEYQAKQLFASAGIPVPRGQVATTPQEAASVYETLKRQAITGNGFACSVKAQLHAGGRGKAGGGGAAARAPPAGRRGGAGGGGGIARGGRPPSRGRSAASRWTSGMESAMRRWAVWPRRWGSPARRRMRAALSCARRGR